MAKKVKLKVSARLLRKKSRRGSFATSKHCRFCANDANVAALNFKNSYMLRGFLTERGKILASRVSGNCALHQRAVTNEIKKSRVMALLPYTASY